MNEIIKLENVSIGFNKTPILGGIDLAVSSNQFWGVIGPNGGGKSTLLKTLIGLIEPIQGKYYVKDGLSFGYVPQYENFDNIFPISVKELVGMGRYSKVPFGSRMKATDWGIVNSSITKVGISKLAENTFRDLSGGEKQRVLIAKAISAEPDILVLDEPTASLDVKGEAEVMSLIKNLKEEFSLTVIMVSHFADTINRYTDRLMLVDKENNIFLSCSKEEAVCDEYLNRYFGMETFKI